MILAQLQLKLQYTYHLKYRCAHVFKNKALRNVSQDKYSTRWSRVLYLYLDMPPHDAFSVHAPGNALDNIKSLQFKR